MSKKDNGDGTTTYTMEADSSVTVGGSVDAKKVKVEGSVVGGSRVKYSVTVPNGTDPNSIDILHPESWPDGTRVQMKSEDYKGTSLEAVVKHVGVGGSQETREGQSIVIEKKPGNKVAIVTGPTSGFTDSGKLKLDIGAGFSVEAGWEHKYDGGAFRSYTVDLNSPEGRASYSDAVFNGNAASGNGKGVSDYKEVYSLDYAYKNGLKIKTPVGDLNIEGHKENSNSTVTVYPDGRVERTGTYDANGDGKVDVTRKTTSTDGGKTWSEPTYTYKLPIRNETDRQYAENFTGRKDIKVGDTVELTLTESQVEEMRKAEQFENERNRPETADQRAYNNASFAFRLVRGTAGNTAGTLEVMYNAYTRPLPEKPGEGPRHDGFILPGTVNVIPAAPPPPQPSGFDGGSVGGGAGGGGGGSW